METFRDEREVLPIFLFYFVVSDEDAHVLNSLQKRKKIISELKRITVENVKSTFFNPLNPVDIKLWFSELGEEARDKVKDFVNSVVQGLEPAKQTQKKRGRKPSLP